MAFTLSLPEIFDIMVMTLALGFIFKDVFSRPKQAYDPLHQFSTKRKLLDLEGLKFSILVFNVL